MAGTKSGVSHSGARRGQGARPPKRASPPKPRRRRKMSKAEQLQYLLQLNQTDGRRSGLVRPINWLVTSLAIVTSLCASFIFVQALMIPDADISKVVISTGIAFIVCLFAGWTGILSSALKKSSVEAKLTYFAMLRKEPTNRGTAIKDNAFMRYWKKLHDNFFRAPQQ